MLSSCSISTYLPRNGRCKFKIADVRIRETRRLDRVSGSSGITRRCFSMSSPGRVLMMWTPRLADSVAPKQQKEVLASLIEAVKNHGRDHRARFVQLFSDQPQSPLDSVLKANGFFVLTQLVYARRPVTPGETVPPLPSEIELVHYSEDLRDDLLSLLAESYEGSLDCPELNGIRSMDDIYESHRGEQPFDPERWKLVRSKGKWIGCLLLSAVESDRVIEISYVALLPAARGKGLGRVLTREAIRYAALKGYDALVLAVDARNTPAPRHVRRRGIHSLGCARNLPRVARSSSMGSRIPSRRFMNQVIA